jgi:hypothetical protein
LYRNVFGVSTRPHSAGYTAQQRVTGSSSLHRTVTQLPDGIDDEVVLDLPIVCEIRPRALWILLSGWTGASGVRLPM